MTNRCIQGDEFGPMAAQMGAEATIRKEEDRASTLVTEALKRAAEITTQANLVETIYQKEFLADARTANELAIALVSGEQVKFDAQSLGEHGDDTEVVKKYLSTFMVQDPSRKDYPFSRLNFPTTAVIMHKNKEHHVDRLSTYNPLTAYSFSPSFNPDITLPALVDPEVRTFAELEELEAIDPGHAQQLLEAYSMAAREQKAKNPQARFMDPLIVRMVAILPTGYDYATDFVPQVELPQERGTKAWDPQLLVNGALNPSGNYLSNVNYFDKDKVVLNRDGKEAALRVTRPLPGEAETERAQALMPLADHEMNRMAVILFPYQVQRRARFDIAPLVSSPMIFDDGGATRGGGATKGGSLGGATIGAGVGGMLGANKRPENFMGDRFIPDVSGRPFIYSVRFLTAQRDPDTITA